MPIRSLMEPVYPHATERRLNAPFCRRSEMEGQTACGISFGLANRRDRIEATGFLHLPDHFDFMDDKALTGRQIAAARILAGITQADLAGRANISVPTLQGMETNERPAGEMADSLAAVRRALEEAGIDFIGSNGEGVGVRLRKSRLQDEGIRPAELNATNDD